jgi:K+-sensing histidine kinase KdpD
MYVRDHRPRRKDADHASPSRRTAVFRLASAMLLAAVSVTVWLAETNAADTRPYLSFFLAVLPICVASSVVGGWRWGAVATGVMSLIGLYFILPPRHSFAFATQADILFFAAMLGGTAYAAYIVGKAKQ